MNLTKDQLLALMNTIDFATDNDASYEESLSVAKSIVFINASS